MPKTSRPASRARHAADLKWISARHLQHFISHAEAAKVDVDQLLEDAGLNRTWLADPDYSVPISAIELMLATITREHKQPLVGFRLSRDIQPATFGPLGIIAQVCPTVGDILETLVRYNGLLSNIGLTSLVHSPGHVEVRWECLAGGIVFRRQATEYVLGAAVTLLRLLIPDRSDLPLCVNFTHTRPPEARHVREYVSHFRCPVYFEQPTASIVLPVAALKGRLRHGDAFVREMMERHAANMLKQRHAPSSIPDEVRHLIRAMILDGVPSKDAVARQLGMSGRSLHRKLREANTSYHAQLDQVRLEIAREHLASADQSSGDISDCLGFSTRQAFLRWFKQSTGLTPSEYRLQLHQEAEP